MKLDLIELYSVEELAVQLAITQDPELAQQLIDELKRRSVLKEEGKS
jgi:hypothetical protein